MRSISRGFRPISGHSRCLLSRDRLESGLDGSHGMSPKSPDRTDSSLPPRSSAASMPAGGDGDAAGASSTLSTCVRCRRGRRLCSKTAPRCGRCASRGVPCVFRLAGLRRAAAGGAAGGTAADESFEADDILVDGVVTKWDGSELVPETKRACVACHGSKRTCEGGIPCGRASSFTSSSGSIGLSPRERLLSLLEPASAAIPKLYPLEMPLLDAISPTLVMPPDDKTPTDCSESTVEYPTAASTAPAKSLVPGSWDPPISPPPRFVDRFLSHIPAVEGIPDGFKLGSLVQTFFQSVQELFGYLHKSSFCEVARNDRVLVSAMCLAALPWSDSPDIAGCSLDLQHRLFKQCVSGILARLDRHLPRIADQGTAVVKTDAELDPVCETLFSMNMLALWASNRGLTVLFDQLADASFRLAQRIGLQRDEDLGPSHPFGRTTRREAWIRKSQRRTLWFTAVFTACFTNSPCKRSVRRAADLTRPIVVRQYQKSLFDRDSLREDFDPDPFEPERLAVFPQLGRPLVFGDLVDWMSLPRGHPRRAELLEVVGRVLSNDGRFDSRFEYIADYLFHTLRRDVDDFLAACKEAGIGPADLRGPGFPHGALAARAARIRENIADLLSCPPHDMREAEEVGDYPRLYRYFANADPRVDGQGIHARTQVTFWLGIRLMLLDVISGLGMHGFEEIAGGAIDAEFADARRLAECIKHAVIYTRHLQSMMDFSNVTFDIDATGPAAPKVGAFHLALLRSYLRSGLPLDPAVARGLDADLDVCLRYVRLRAPRNAPPGAAAHNSGVAARFSRLVAAFKASAEYLAWFRTQPEVVREAEGHGHGDVDADDERRVEAESLGAEVEKRVGWLQGE
ncbi:hypothetical protein DFJ74DRAFT_743869 [Hyaloraphidium curvatum]|nr:hypothetical protein DFJ74DRAFT_743869 [Hyaloraphidium curvatum]